MQLPAEMTPAIREALGYANFQCAPIAAALRAGGAAIKHKAEDEQAHVLFWFLKLAIEHGDDWKDRVGDTLERIAAEAA